VSSVGGDAVGQRALVGEGRGIYCTIWIFHFFCGVRAAHRVVVWPSGRPIRVTPLEQFIPWFGRYSIRSCHFV
jgi:hypothetical protein